MSCSIPVPRYRLIDRSRISAVSLDQQLPADHEVRLLWDFVCRLDLSALQRPCKAVQGHAGAPLIPTPLLLALWLYATIEGITSSRQLTQKCSRDLPYQWLCGAAPVNYHTLNDFHLDHGDALEELFVDYIAALRQQELVDLSEVTLDGRKILANASKDHFHREPTLQRHLQEASEHLGRLQAQRAEGGGRSARQEAAQQRAARDRQARLQQAVAVVQQRHQQREQSPRSTAPPEDARANSTDPESAKMKLPNGGYAQAYNVQTVTAAANGLIVTVAVTNQGSDNGQLSPMLEKLEEEQHTLPKRALLDSGFSDQQDIERWEQRGVEVLMPPKNERKEKQQGRDPYAAKRRDSEAVATWRARMGTAAAQQRYRRRAPVAEGVHAQQANRGWRRFRVRGLVKVQVEAVWQAWAHNLRRLLALGVSLAGTVRAGRV